MNDDFQYAVIGDLLVGGTTRRASLEVIAAENFSPDYITVPELRTAYDILIKHPSCDMDILSRDVRQKISSETIQKAVEHAACDDPYDIGRHVRGVKNAAIRARAQEVFDAAMRANVSGEDFLGSLTRRFQNLGRTFLSQATAEGCSLADIADPIPEEDDPDCLFRGRFLTKGAALVLASVSGAGKSVITLQLAYAWALGRPAFGIEPLRPLKIGIFQTEDDDQEMAGFRNSMRQGYERFCEWTADDISQAERNIRIFPMDGQVGDAFISYFQRVQRKERCDLVVINPLQGVTDFDISDNTQMREFVRQKLDGVIKLVDGEEKCGLMIVHHTNKPPPSSMRAGFGTDQYAQYVGAGASELTNWMRAMLAIMPDVRVPGQYKLVAAKRGKRLGWPRLAEPTPNPTKLIRHSTPDERVIFWHEVNAAATPKGDEANDGPCVTKDAARLANYLKDNALPLTETRKFAKDLLGRKRGDAAYDELTAHLSDYEVVIAATGISTQKVIGSTKSVENAISTLRGKHLQDVAVKFGKNNPE